MQRLFISALACLISVNLFSQIIDYDGNNDGCINSTDILNILSVYGDCEIIYECGTIVEYDGYEYTTVQIGNKCWFAENLRTTRFKNGDEIPFFNDCMIGGWPWELIFTPLNVIYGGSEYLGQECSTCYDYSPNINACEADESLVEYGRLYNWFSVNDTRGLCPSGWHVSTTEEWNELNDFIVSEGNQVEVVLKSNTGWENNENGTDAYGFDARPAGDINYLGTFNNAGTKAQWWTTNYVGLQGIKRTLITNQIGVPSSLSDQRAGLSIRCVKD